ncbi:MAG: hypothetical protein ACXVAY_04670 [Mucilaginibacter sp.]
MEILEKYVIFDFTTLIQILVFTSAGLISIVTLNKDLVRSKTEIIRKEARKIKLIVIVLTCLSILSVFASNYNAKSNKKALNDSLSALRKDNNNLRHTLNTNSIIQSNLMMENQKESTKKLSDAANSLKDLISGSNEVPIFHFGIKEDLVFGALFKKDNKPIYNMIASITNFDNYEQCPIKSFNGNKSIKSSCLQENTLNISPIQVLDNVNIDNFIRLPNSDQKKTQEKYMLTINFKSKKYIEEAIYRKDSLKDNLYQSVRIIELTNDKITKIWMPDLTDKGNIPIADVNWDKEFPDFFIHSVYVF